ncbi:hypothetical protein F4818DRAFT_424613 [Hypoxylon cercidicola]|nr:hypothetical protein F4818DRAFT_424613 [Hypoxylon cercidicola]
MMCGVVALATWKSRAAVACIRTVSSATQNTRYPHRERRMIYISSSRTSIVEKASVRGLRLDSRSWKLKHVA